MKKAVKRIGSVLLVFSALFVLHSILTGTEPYSRLISQIEKKVARALGTKAKPMQIIGKVHPPGARINARQASWASLSDNQGSFSLPRMVWYPGSSYDLTISYPGRKSRRLRVYARWRLPDNGNFHIGEFSLDAGQDYESEDGGDSPDTSLVHYDSNNDQYYKQMFNEITAGKSRDEEKLQLLNEYVARRRLPGESVADKRIKKKSKALSNLSARDILETEVRQPYKCGTLSLVMATLAHAGNYKVRWVDMIGLGGSGNKPRTHVVVEVFYNGEWHLYDPTYGVSYRNESGEVASHKDIRLDVRILFQNVWTIRANEEMPDFLPVVYETGVHRFYLFN
jgi:hypothetical protein